MGFFFFSKKLLYKILVKYYLSDSIKTPFEDFAIGLQNILAGLVSMDMWKLKRGKRSRIEFGLNNKVTWDLRVLILNMNLLKKNIDFKLVPSSIKI